MKVEVCFKCKEFVFLNEALVGKERESQFVQKHGMHPRQIVDEHELDEGYHDVSSDIDKTLKRRMSRA